MAMHYATETVQDEALLEIKDEVQKRFGNRARACLMMFHDCDHVYVTASFKSKIYKGSSLGVPLDDTLGLKILLTVATLRNALRHVEFRILERALLGHLPPERAVAAVQHARQWTSDDNLLNDKYPYGPWASQELLNDVEAACEKICRRYSEL